MQDDKMILPEFMIADLYKNHLVEPWQETSVERSAHVSKTKKIKEREDEKNPQLKFLGDNLKRVGVIVCDAEATFMNDVDLTFLTKVLSACNLNLSDIAIINTAQSEVHFEILKTALNSAYVLLLGVEPASIKLPFSVPNFQVQEFSGCTIMTSPSLSLMLSETQESKLLKRQLWTGLQKMFKLN